MRWAQSVQESLPGFQEDPASVVLDSTDDVSMRGSHGYCTFHRILNCLAVTLLLCLSPVSAAPVFDYTEIEQAIREQKFSWAQQRLRLHLRPAPHDFCAQCRMRVIRAVRNDVPRGRE